MSVCRFLNLFCQPRQKSKHLKFLAIFYINRLILRQLLDFPITQYLNRFKSLFYCVISICKAFAEFIFCELLEKFTEFNLLSVDRFERASGQISLPIFLLSMKKYY
jgi:hypothetical protein